MKNITKFIRQNKKTIITYGGLAAVVIVIALIWCFWDKSVGVANNYTDNNSSVVSDDDFQIVSETNLGIEGIKVYRVEVTELMGIVESGDDMGGEMIVQRTQIFMAKVLNGPYKGMELPMTLDLTDITGTGQGVITVKPGDKVRGFFEPDPETGELVGTCSGFVRDMPLMWLGIGFIALLLLFFGRNGLKSFSALVITCVMLIFVMIPLVYYGMHPVLAVTIFGLATIIVTLLLIYGPSISSLAAGCGAIGGVITSAVISYIMKDVIRITGAVDENSINLIFTPNGSKLSVSSIMFAAIVIGSLGGTIDVSVSISSSLEELREKTEGKVKGWELARSGMSIGRSIMGASLNTMILAYVGGSFELLMLFVAYYSTMQEIINHELIALELLRSLAGCFGLLFTVPITSVVAAYFASNGDMGKPNIRGLAVVRKPMEFINKLRKISEKNRLNIPKKSIEEEPAIENLFERACEHYDELSDTDVTEEE